MCSAEQLSGCQFVSPSFQAILETLEKNNLEAGNEKEISEYAKCEHKNFSLSFVPNHALLATNSAICNCFNLDTPSKIYQQSSYS